MRSNIENPFSVTKATEFTDEEIQEYWVDSYSLGVKLDPKESLPKYVIGSKGCGKTHLLRYYSFPLQKIRHKNNIADILSKDQYIGLFSQLPGLNAERFQLKGIDSEKWLSVFTYYFELYICENLLRTIQEIVKGTEAADNEQYAFTNSVLQLFTNYQELIARQPSINDIESLLIFLSGLRKDIDGEVLNAPFTRKLDSNKARILFASGSLLFGIPKAAIDYLEAFGIVKDVKFIYILDELETLLNPEQKELVNTWVWDKQAPVTFWIGARRYGFDVKTRSGGEQLKNGSEYQQVDVDDIFRENEKAYHTFAEELYARRLFKYFNPNQSFPPKPKPKERNPWIESLKNTFESAESELISTLIQEKFKNKNKPDQYPHLKALREKIKRGILSGNSLDITSDSQIERVIKSIQLGTNHHPLEQKYKIFYLYQLWSKNSENDTFTALLKKINEDFTEYKNKGSTSVEKNKFDDIIEKRKKDLTAQLARENNTHNIEEYSGLSNFIDITIGNPRALILLLKTAIDYATINGEKPLEAGGRVSLESQYLAVYNVARGFFSDGPELLGDAAKQLYNGIKNLGDYLDVLRFCDKPPETTLSCFELKLEELSEITQECIKNMEIHGFITRDKKGRKERNTGIVEVQFRLSRLLAPLWNLPIVKRGSIAINTDDADSIFNIAPKVSFDQFIVRRKNELNAPDFGRSKKRTQKTSSYQRKSSSASSEPLQVDMNLATPAQETLFP
jgi:hypothetical protein